MPILPPKLQPTVSSVILQSSHRTLTNTVSDALLRHWRTCETRLKSGTSPPILRPSKRGRRRNACERCAQAKKKCTGSVPCQLCSDQRQSCSLASTTTSQGLPLTPPSLGMAMGWMGVPCMRIRFLAVFTSTHGMANSFECGDTLTRKKMISSSRQACDTFSWAIYGSVTTSYTSLTPPWTDLYQMSTEPHHPALPCSLPLPDSLIEPTAIISYYDTEIAQSHTLATKSQEIVSGILSLTTLSRKLDLNSAQSSCAQFFSPTNLESFLGVFFQIWYPNWPVFHKPTFFASQRSPQLIAALSLIGACLSPEADDREQAITCMDAVEDWIFSSLELCEDTVHGPSQVRERLDLIQAAYALVLLMNWEGSKTQITRARRRCFSEIVSVARSLYPFAMAHADTTDTWMDFTLREECIRTLQYIFLLDCAFVIFHNSVPRMIVTELRFRLASSEELFLAPDPETWAALQPDVHIQRTTLYQAIDMMMTNEIGPEQWKIFEKMSLLNTFTIISGQ